VNRPRRHHRYFDTAYNLEPNVKSSPGGLRDIQTIGWVAKRHFGTDTLDELVGARFLTREELRKLKAGQSFLWKVRFGLHVLTGRREDRLLFDYQIKLAKMFGYEDASFTLAVEQLMQKYYRSGHGRELAERNAAGKLFREAILTQSGSRADQRAISNLQRLSGSDPSGSFRALPLRPARAVRSAAAAPRIARRAGGDHPADRTHVALIDEEFRQTRAITVCSWKFSARRRSDARDAPHEFIRRARPLHPLVRPHRRPHAV